jgi:hypothetical protein
VTAERPTSLEATDAHGRVVRVQFVWHHDRFAHTVTVIAQDRSIPLLASHEGLSDQPWPPSPPLQSLSIESGASGPMALLVGMAGDAHWSLSIAPESGATALVFDVACRAKSLPVFLGSRYRTMVEPHESGESMLFPVLDRHLQVSLPQSEAPPAQVQRTGDGFGIVVDSRHANLLPRTFRWKYRVALVDG